MGKEEGRCLPCGVPGSFDDQLAQEDVDSGNKWGQWGHHLDAQALPGGPTPCGWARGPGTLALCLWGKERLGEREWQLLGVSGGLSLSLCPHFSFSRGHQSGGMRVRRDMCSVGLGARGTSRLPLCGSTC